MRAGGLRNRVTIRVFTTDRDSTGQVIQVWEDGETIWAEVKGISGRELIAAGAEMSEVTFRMWVRYRYDVTSASRIIWKQKGHDAKAFDIQSAIPDEKATRLELLCKGGLKP
ncbi:phage head closure protein [Enterobacter hormaechei]|uniref:phage head closure protein n=1 Tax=Enterobacter hormaechei TaxID=158836 RepID=UPI00209B392E|nr:phage head closure protein [Enterobacter hormaechei]MCO7443170.1 phage head closure protein [Enterobacter hormaechei]MCO7444532.1 phage head closure protein [Enterobacter hormaechei]MCO7445006.1 phage head closure protein [Enterobacter hormaechei]MCO7446053.1 phage head closure protein [Enterobacter hormaechei]